MGWIEELSKAAEARGLALVDAPVTGSKAQAAGGQLLFLAGGPAAAVERVAPALRSMGRDVIHLGHTGSGARMKLINNFLCGVQIASLALSLIHIYEAAVRMGSERWGGGDAAQRGTGACGAGCGCLLYTSSNRLGLNL